MKNKLKVYLAGIILLFVAATACTQKMRAGTADYGIQQGYEIPANYIGTDVINTKVLRSFHRVYGDMPGAKWTKSSGNYIVSFRNNDMLNTIYYKLNGAVDAELHFYDADQLVPSVRGLVQSVFPNYVLSQVVEVQKNNVTAFYVEVQDATTIKKVKVVGEEWEVVETLVKR